MTDILIRGIKMPERCDAKCPLYNTGRGYFDCVVTKQSYNWGLPGRPSDCPLYELQPHGDLIDVRKIREEIDDIWDGRPLAPIGAKVLSIIDSAPVIVPANKEDTP